jgi:hypothetical protein
MRNLLVIGDSFCDHRYIDTDWPVYLSNLLNLNLIGAGLPGESWWFIREHFMKIYTSDEFKKTDLIVYCHTDPNRIIGTDGTLRIGDDDPDVIKLYLTKLQNLKFNDWCCRQWFKELNNLLADKKVIHVQNFPLTSKYFNKLNGVKVDRTTLYDLSLRELTDCNKFIYDTRNNHFSTENNLKIANMLFEIVNTTTNWQNETRELQF